MFEKVNQKLLKTYKERDFITGGCYVYAQIISQIYGGEIYINRQLEHCAIKYNEFLYDVKGKIKNEEGFRPLKEKEWKMCEKEYILKNRKEDDELIKNIVNLYIRKV